MKIIQDLKRQVIRNIREILAPHVWTSGYERTKLFAFAEVNGRDTRSMGKVFNEDLTYLQGFTADGTFDAVAGGCACTPFESYCLEDLLAIEAWLNKNFAKGFLKINGEVTAALTSFNSTEYQFNQNRIILSEGSLQQEVQADYVVVS